MNRIAVLGAGMMGEAIIGGLVGSTPESSVVVCESSAERAEYIAAKYQVEIADARGAVREANVVLVVVKPPDVISVLQEIAHHVMPEVTIASLAAGVQLEALEAVLPHGTAVVRVMPNTPALVGAGISTISAGRHATDVHLAGIEHILSACGRVIRVPESAIDAVTAVSGSGPAYLFAVAEAMIEAGVHLGLTRMTATDLVTHTMFGASLMLRDSGKSATVLREQVTSPAGTTAAALRLLDERGVRAAFIAAMTAARDRSREIGKS
ncbi:MAG: pyrroline-5-carboxylate reductase [Actinomycetota bacterium]